MTFEETTYKMVKKDKFFTAKTEIGGKEILGHKSSKMKKSKDFVCSFRGSISALSTDITPKCHHISTKSADINKLDDMA